MSAFVDYLKICASPLHVSVLESSPARQLCWEGSAERIPRALFLPEAIAQCRRRACCDMLELLHMSCLNVLALAS